MDIFMATIGLISTVACVISAFVAVRAKNETMSMRNEIFTNKGNIVNNGDNRGVIAKSVAGGVSINNESKHNK